MIKSRRMHRSRRIDLTFCLWAALTIQSTRAFSVQQATVASSTRRRQKFASEKPYSAALHSRLFHYQHDTTPVRIRRSSINQLLSLIASYLSVLLAFPKHALAASASTVLSSTRRSLLQHKKRILWSLLSFIVLKELISWIRVKRRQAIDATSEWGRYARHPGARGRALANLVLMKLLPVYLLAKIMPGKWRNRMLVYSGGVFADGLLMLGPLYVKLGQIVSCRENFLPEPWKHAMERLQDQVPAKSGDQALTLAYEAWEAGPEDFHATFDHFDTTPLAAASLGQVHQAVLKSNNDTVAVKVQRAFLREIYDQDLDFLTKIAKTVDKFGGQSSQVGGIEQSWTEIFKDAEEILYREIDYRDEAENGIRFCNDFGLGLGGKPLTNCTARSRDGKQLPSAADWLRAPYVYGDISSEKVLVMEFVPSIKITNNKKLKEHNVTLAQQEYLADCLARSYLRQFCCNLFFSTDPHPGNLGVEILQPDAQSPEQRVRLVFYDFGQAATLNEDQADGILDVIEAIVDSDVEKSIRSFEKMGVLKENADLDKVRAKVSDNFKTGKVKANRKRLSQRGYKFKDEVPSNSTDTTTNSTSNSTKDSEVMQFFTLPAEYAFVGRALSQMDGVGKSLDPEFDFVSSAAPWIYEIKGAGKYLQEEVLKWFSNARDKIQSVICPNHKKS